MGAKKTGFDELDVVLAHAVYGALPATQKVVAKGCLNIKKGAQKTIRAASKHGYLPHYPGSITYDTKTEGTVVSGEVGPVVERPQGTLALVLEYGGIHSAPIPHMIPAADAEEDPFYSNMEQVGIDLLEGVEEAPDAPLQDPS